MQRVLITRSEEETRAAAREFSVRLKPGDVVALYGELGSGKTQFVKGVCEAFHVREHVASPTFVLLHRYTGTNEHGDEQVLYHLDLYRVQSIEEVYDIGYEELFSGPGITLIEWAEQIAELLPARRYDVRITLGTVEHERHLEIGRREVADAVHHAKASA
jgi:tRNA threonylcarbamoyladenosine biosynthesis protein TsaE